MHGISSALRITVGCNATVYTQTSSKSLFWCAFLTVLAHVVAVGLILVSSLFSFAIADSKQWLVLSDVVGTECCQRETSLCV